jgi:hypothetical protein
MDAMTEWIPTSDRLPELGQAVWLYEPGRGMWIGSREDTGDGWLWGNYHGSIWHNGVKWTGDSEQDDDYQPTQWIPLPDLPSP